MSNLNMASLVYDSVNCSVDEQSVLEEAESSIDANDDDDDEPLVPPPISWFESSSHSATNDIPKMIAEIPYFNPAREQHDEQEQQEERAHAESSLIGRTATTVETIGGIQVPIRQNHYAPTQTIGRTHPSPSWKEISSQVLPAAARELLSSSLRRIYYTARLSYSKGLWYRKYSDMGNNAGGFAISPSNLELPPAFFEDLPPFSSLSWIDRQLVQEWRTYLPSSTTVSGGGEAVHSSGGDDDTDNEDVDFDRARALVPNPMPRPRWRKQDVCYDCHKPFGPTRLRHHCRLCGNSFCQSHSASTHKLPHLGYDPDVPERVCDVCKRTLLEQNLAERVAWRLARCRDYLAGNLTPYFETGIDSYEQVALRITKAALAMAKSIPLGVQATVAVETVDVLRKYGLHGIYGIMLRQEFLAAADLLRRALGINRTSWPLSVHELSAAIFYALAQHRAMRGLNPEHEHVIHKFQQETIQQQQQQQQQQQPLKQVSPSWALESERDVDNYEMSALSFHSGPVMLDPAEVVYNPELSHTAQDIDDGPSKCQVDPPSSSTSSHKDDTALLSFVPVCDPVPDHVIGSLVFYAPIALNFIYATKEVDMQLLAAQQGWRLLYAFLEQDHGIDAPKITDRPASALFLHQEFKIACLSVRGTATINDVITDIRQIPVPFPDSEVQDKSKDANTSDDGWTDVFRGQGVALCGMAAAAVNLYREHIDSLTLFARQGYRIRITGHSLGGGVATMIGALMLRHLKRDPDLGSHMLEERDLLRVYAYGTPSCVDAKLADAVNSFVTTVVLHDDVFPRLTPTSCRGLLKHLLHIRETWVKTHLERDLMAIKERAQTAWAPKFRQGFTLMGSSRSIKRYCRKKVWAGTRKLLSVKDKLIRDSNDDRCTHEADGKTGTSGLAVEEHESYESDSHQWGERFFVPANGFSPSKSYEDVREESMESIQQQEDAMSNTDDSDAEPEAQLLLEFLGGVDNRAQGIVIDGDEFFDSEEKVIESDNEGSETQSKMEHFAEPSIPDESLTTGDSWSLEMRDEESSPEQKAYIKSPTKDSPSDIGPAGVIVEETPLPRMFVPGKIIHLYSHRGVYKAAYVPRAFRDLRRISLAGNMLSDHTAKAYYEGLLEVQTVRSAPERPPRWTAFDEDDTW